MVGAYKKTDPAPMVGPVWGHGANYLPRMPLSAASVISDGPPNVTVLVAFICFAYAFAAV